jgi:hypothetical protein
MSLRWALFGTNLGCLVACGLSLQNAPDTADGGSVPPTQSETGTPSPTDDAAITADAKQDSSTVEGGVSPSPLNVKHSYAIAAGNMYELSVGTTATFTLLPSAECPNPAEETAVFSDERIFVTSDQNDTLYSYAKGTGCTQVKKANKDTYPGALGVAPKGTVSSTEETLVGYIGAAYVKVDTSNGTVTTINNTALGNLRPSGDVAAIGTRGFLAAEQGKGDCPANGDCVVEVELTGGTRVASGVFQQFPGLRIYGLAQSEGRLLLYADDKKVYSIDLTNLTLGTAIANFPTGANFTGAGAAPFAPAP